MLFDNDALGHIQWTLEIKLIDISNNTAFPCSLGTCLNKKVFAPHGQFSLVILNYRQNI